MPYEEVSKSPDGLARVYWDDDDNLWAEGVAFSPTGERVTRSAMVLNEDGSVITRRKSKPPQAGEVGFSTSMGSNLYVLADSSNHPRFEFRRKQLLALERGLRPGIPAPLPEWQQEGVAAGREFMRAEAARERQLLESFKHMSEPGYESPQPVKDESKRGTLADPETLESVRFDADEQVARALQAGEQVARDRSPHWRPASGRIQHVTFASET